MRKILKTDLVCDCCHIEKFYYSRRQKKYRCGRCGSERTNMAMNGKEIWGRVDQRRE